MDFTHQFLDYLALEKNYSALTVTSYKRDLEDFINFYQQEENTTEIAISAHAQKLGGLALQLGYEGSLAVGALEDEIRFY
ncbi:MAG: site-specific integrase, partial [Algoriella sp.]